MENKNYRDALALLITKEFAPAGYKITKNITLGSVPESAKYEALSFALDGWNVIYRKGKVTPDRPGAFLAVWQRPFPPNINGNKPVPFNCNELDYLFVQVESDVDGTNDIELRQSVRKGIFIFPVSILIAKGIVCSSIVGSITTSSTKNKGKTGFRVFPPWSQNRGVEGTRVFSASGKKSQRWQLPYFLTIDENGRIDPNQLNKVLNHKSL